MCAQEDSAIRGVTAGHTCARAARPRHPPRTSCRRGLIDLGSTGVRCPRFPMTKLLLVPHRWRLRLALACRVDCADAGRLRAQPGSGSMVRPGRRRPATATGTNDRPFASLADIERCAPAGATITVLAPAEGAAPLDGGIRLKDRQKLLGLAPRPGGKPAARLTNTGGSGDAVTLAHGNEVAHLHIDNPAGAAIFGDNVNGTHLHDLLLTRRGTAPPTAARPVAVPRRQDRRGGGHEPVGPARLQPGGREAAAQGRRHDAGRRLRRRRRHVKYSIQRLAVQDNPVPRTAARPVAGGSVHLCGRPCLGTARGAGFFGGERAFGGLAIQAYDRSTITGEITDLRRRQPAQRWHLCRATGFLCSGLDQTFKSSPALREARASAGERRAHRAQHRPAAVCRHACAMGRRTAPGSSSRRPTIRAVRRSRSTSSAATSPRPSAAGFYTFYIRGRPAKDVIDFGCVNPDPAGTAPDPGRVPARRLHEHRTEPDLRQLPQQQDPHAAERDRAAGSRRDDGAGQLLRRHRPGRREGRCARRVPPVIWPESQQGRAAAGPQHPQRALRAVHRRRPGNSPRASTPGSTSRRTPAPRKNDRCRLRPPCGRRCGLRRDFAEAQASVRTLP